MSNDYCNLNTNPRTLITLTLTLTDPHGAFERFFAPEFCDFMQNYYCTNSHFEPFNKTAYLI